MLAEALDFVGDILGGSNGANRNARLQMQAANDADARNLALYREQVYNSDRQRAEDWTRAGEEWTRNTTYQDRINAENVAEARRVADLNYAREKDAQQNSIAWRVADAQNAGIHPLYAMGSQGISISPATPSFSQGASGGSYSGGASLPGAPYSESNFVPQMGKNMGQNISRAVLKMMSKNERANTMQAEVARQRQLMLENQQLTEGDLRNELLRLQVVAAARDLGPPGPPNGAQLKAAPVKKVPATIVMSEPGQPAKEAGAITDWSYVRTNRGYAIVPSNDAKQRMEDSAILEVPWMLRNGLGPNMNSDAWRPDPKKYPLPKGASDWRWSIPDQQFIPHYGRKK